MQLWDSVKKEQNPASQPSGSTESQSPNKKRMSLLAGYSNTDIAEEEDSINAVVVKE